MTDDEHRLVIPANLVQAARQRFDVVIGAVPRGRVGGGAKAQ
jgi:hypothetical protein